MGARAEKVKRLRREAEIENPAPNSEQERSQLALFDAARESKAKGIRRALLRGANTLSPEKGTGATALMIAASQGDLGEECVRELLPLSNSLATSFSGADALMVAARHGGARLVTLLAPLSNPLRLNCEGRSALSIAMELNFEDVVKALLPISDIARAEGGGVTPLMRAARSRTIKTVALGVPGSNLGAQDDRGKTALMHAIVGMSPGQCFYVSPEAKKCILLLASSMTAKMLDLKDQSGKTAINWLESCNPQQKNEAAEIVQNLREALAKRERDELRQTLVAFEPMAGARRAEAASISRSRL